VEGSVRTNKYTTKENEQKKITQIVATKIGPLGAKGEVSNDVNRSSFGTPETELPF
jgi:single-stranded DNA-binding protein